MKVGKISKLIWIPRCIVIMFGLFLLVFSLDVFSMDNTPLEKIGGFIFHSLPSILIFFVLYITWKKPLPGGIAFIGLSIIIAVSIYQM